MPPSCGACQSAIALVEQCLAVKAAPHTVTSRSSANGSIRSWVKTCTLSGQRVRCHTDPGRYGSWFPGLTNTGTRNARELVAQKLDRVLSHEVVLVGVTGDADRVHALVSTHRQRASKRVAQLRPATIRVVPGLGATKDAIEMDVGDVEELHGAKNCMRRVGRTLMSGKSRPTCHLSFQTLTVGGATVVPMKRALPVIALAVLLGATVVYHQIAIGGAPITHGTVSRVVDGDTIYVSAGGRSQDVRLIGVDTPETVDPNRPVGCYGPQASAFMKHWLTGQPVTLVYDQVTHDKYGRYLAYVFVAVSRSSGGCCSSVTPARFRFPPNVAHASEYSALESAAAVAGRGLWSACQ